MAERTYYRIDWEDLSYENGFTDDKTMLEEWYNCEQMTQEAIGRKLGICAKRVGEQMRLYGISVRKHGTKPGELRGPRLPRGR